MKTVEFLAHLNGLGIKIWIENDTGLTQNDLKLVFCRRGNS